ncbi:MAG: hypothetical protein SPJ65_13885 [Roseburia sp.]|nr:hypothetical protein [Roseburia sp.]
MDISSIQNVTAASVTTSEKTAVTKKEKDQTTKVPETGVIYEKSSDAKNSTGVVKNKTKSNAAIVAQLKADQEARSKQLTDLVSQMLSKQGVTLGKADDMWKFLAKGDFTVTPEVKAQAQADIAEDGYWGVEQTSDRIVSFAKALSNDNPEYADKLIAAFKKGFDQATKAWGQKLPDISQRTYDAVLEKFDKWVNESKTSDEN